MNEVYHIIQDVIFITLICFCVGFIMRELKQNLKVKKDRYGED